MGKHKNFYAIQYPSHLRAVYSHWDDCERAVKYVSGARYRGFATRGEAVRFMLDGAAWDNNARAPSSNNTNNASGAGGKKRKHSSDEGGGGGSGRKRRYRVEDEEQEEDEANIPTQPIDYCSQSQSQSQQPQCRAATLFFDGGSRGNPGPAGSGAVLFADDATGQRTLWSGSTYLGRETNNVAEYRGLILGLQAAKDHGVRRLVAKGDSQLVVNQMEGRWRVEKPHLKKLQKEACALAMGFECCRVEYVPREQNQAADRLANEAMDRRR